jgi:hypothetical protein
MTTQRSALYPGPTPQDLDRIPEDLKQLPQWVLWRGADRIDQQTGEVKLNKIPIDPQTLKNASTTDPETWGTFDLSPSKSGRMTILVPTAVEGLVTSSHTRTHTLASIWTTAETWTLA